MNLRVAILGSGSAGNCALVETNHTLLLLDAGLSGRKITQRLRDYGYGWEDLDAILLTHEHGDHTTGLSALKHHPALPLYASRGTHEALQAEAPEACLWRTFLAGQEFRLGDLTVETFSVPHDARDPVGFVLSTGEGDLLSPRRRLAWLTDLGHVTPAMRARIREVDILSLEANYCPDLLAADTRRPWSLRQRISGRHGHLSNHAARDLLAEVDSPQWQHVILTHLSRDCNRPEVVTQTLGNLPCWQRCSLTLAAPEGNPGWHEV